MDCSLIGGAMLEIKMTGAGGKLVSASRMITTNRLANARNLNQISEGCLGRTITSTHLS